MQDEEITKCFICEAQTNNGQHLGQILCDTCKEEIELAASITVMPEHFYDLEA